MRLRSVMAELTISFYKKYFTSNFYEIDNSLKTKIHMIEENSQCPFWDIWNIWKKFVSLFQLEYEYK